MKCKAPGCSESAVTPKGWCSKKCYLKHQRLNEKKAPNLGQISKEDKDSILNAFKNFSKKITNK